jgi:hypothetical protein
MGSGAAGQAGASGVGQAGAGSAGRSTTSDAVVGAFLVELVPQKGDTPPFTNVTGQVSDGPSPESLVWVKKAESGGCQLLEPQVPFCDPSCGGNAVCVSDGVCQSYPAAKDLGPIVVKGLGDDLSMTAISQSYQVAVETPYPAAAEGAELTIVVAGGAFGAFDVSTPMVAPLLVAASSLPLESGKPLALAWTRASAGASSRIAAEVDISHHGGSKGKIKCDVPDSGSLEISADLVSSLIALGVTGFPRVILGRSTSASTAIAPGNVTLQALSAVTIGLTVPGVTSCTADADCAPGKTCQSNSTCTP